MKARLLVTDGPHRAHIIRIGRGQVLRIGRTRWADDSLPADTRLSSVHFSAEFDGAALLITDLSDGEGLQCPEGVVHSARLPSGTRFRAGQSEFLVELPSDPHGSSSGPAAPGGSGSSSEPPWNWREIPWSKSAGPIAAAATGPAGLLTSLIDARLYSDAWLLVGMRAGATQLVGWLAGEIFRKLEPGISQEERARFAAVQRWTEEATPQRLTEVVRHIPEELETPGAWIVQAVGWTAPNLVADEVGQVPVPPGLFSRACACAVSFLAIGPPVSPLHDCQARLLQLAAGRFGLTEPVGA